MGSVCSTSRGAAGVSNEASNAAVATQAVPAVASQAVPAVAEVKPEAIDIAVAEREHPVHKSAFVSMISPSDSDHYTADDEASDSSDSDAGIANVRKCAPVPRKAPADSTVVDARHTMAISGTSHRSHKETSAVPPMNRVCTILPRHCKCSQYVLHF